MLICTWITFSRDVTRTVKIKIKLYPKFAIHFLVHVTGNKIKLKLNRADYLCSMNSALEIQYLKLN